MNTEVTKSVYDGQSRRDYGSFKNLESAHMQHSYFNCQQTSEDIDEMDRSIPYLHLMEFRNGEHYNDLFFTA